MPCGEHHGNRGRGNSLEIESQGVEGECPLDYVRWVMEKVDAMKLAQRVQVIKPSSTLAVTALVKKMTSEGHKVIGFGAGEPDFDTPQHIKDSAAEALKSGLTKYEPVSGTPAALKAVALQMELKLGRNLGPGNRLSPAAASTASTWPSWPCSNWATRSSFPLPDGSAIPSRRACAAPPWWKCPAAWTTISRSPRTTGEGHHAALQGVHYQQPVQSQRHRCTRRRS